MTRRSASNATAVALRSARTALKASETFGAAAAVIAARTEMTALAYANPSAEAGVEMNLMVTEKVAAFSEAGAAVAAGAGEMASRGARFATEEAAVAGRSLSQFAACRSPMDLLNLQSRLATDFFSRSVAFGLGLNADVARAGERALHPIHKTVTANNRRLKSR